MDYASTRPTQNSATCAGVVNIKTATVTTATKAIDTADDIFVIGTAANLTVTDIVIV